MQIATIRRFAEFAVTRSSLYLAFGPLTFWAACADHPRQSNEPFAWVERPMAGTMQGRIGALEWCVARAA